MQRVSSRFTGLFVVCRRKNALQDMQDIRSKLMPRATSPQTRQIKGKPEVRLFNAITEKKLVVEERRRRRRHLHLEEGEKNMEFKRNREFSPRHFLL